MVGFTFANTTEKVPGDGDIPVEFTLKASPSTDVWSKPPSTNRFNAPILYKSARLSSFKRARVALTANWTQQYDQGGLILVIKGQGDAQKWIKTGIEFVDEKPNISTVVKDRWADWSLLPVPSGGPAATVEMVRQQDGSLWIYLVEGIQRVPIREVTWAFEDEGDKECWVGTYVARPSDKGGELVVDFRHLTVDLED
ncbi:hypothetical protein DTO271G3_8578 [Paecilomyces variotii]|nr:hypothetical protein DTO271G3_8578 [Paecilomyces variotii]